MVLTEFGFNWKIFNIFALCHFGFREGWRVASCFFGLRLHVNLFGCMFFFFGLLFQNMSFRAARFSADQHFTDFLQFCRDFQRRYAPWMGARERGRVAASSPVVLCPVPATPAGLRFRDCNFFFAGFITAVIFIWWLLFGIVHVD